ncbi:MAG: alpha/beta fold hydrolase [Actinomycetes bacterium]
MPLFPAADGTRLAYTEVGSGPPLLCVPGGPGRAAAYLEDLGGVAEQRTLVRLDNRGTGMSEVPDDPSTLRFDRMADDVEALRNHLGLQQADVLGHSAGSLLAQIWASKHPDRVRSLVLVTPVASLQGGTRSDVPQIWASRSDEPWYPDAKEAADALADAAPAQRQALVRAVRPFLYGRWDERTQAHAASADRQSNRRAEESFGLGAEQVDVAALERGLRAVHAPVLVVGGERDGATGVEAVRQVAASFRTAREAVLPRAGHFPWVDEPEAFADVVGRFLAGL